MKLKPEEHRKAAADLRKLAETSSKPDEKQFLLKTAKMFEYLAREAKRGGMKLKPEEHRKAAKNLGELADLATKPEEKQFLLNLAKGFESLAKLGERRAQACAGPEGKAQSEHGR